MAYAKWIGGALGWILTGGSPLGALAGFCIGYFFDDEKKGTGKGQQQSFTGNSYQTGNQNRQYSTEEQRNSFLFSLLVLSSYIIKADGKVMHSEMEYVRGWLQNNFGTAAKEQGNMILKRLFEEQKRIGPYAFKEMIRKSCMEMNLHIDYSQRLQLVAFLLGIARADGYLAPDELSALSEVASYLRISQTDFQSMLNMRAESTEQDKLSEAYKVLGVEPTATDDEVRKAYRQMALKHHPDRVAALGEDVRKAAERKFQEINEAKERIYRARGL